MHTLLQQVAAAQTAPVLSARWLCPRIQLSRATLGRWRQRQRSGQPLLRPPGPAKTLPLPLDLIQEQIKDLAHGRRRTQGTGPLYRRHRAHIARRPLGQLVSLERQRRSAQLRQQTQHLTWLCPQTVWAFDSTEWKTVPSGPKVQVLASCDLASRYGLELQVHPALTGPQVADYLAGLIRHFGAPLFLKRDNGAVLRTPHVQAVLAQAGILPLDSPSYYPPYNGAIERYIGEVKAALPEGLPCPPSGNLSPVRACLQGVRHQLNAQPRRRLKGSSPTEVFYHGPRFCASRPERTAIFNWIWRQAQSRLASMERVNQRTIQTAWRHAAESWLRSQGLLTTNTNPENP